MGGEMRGRIVFTDNPWPEGHAIAQLTLGARLHPEQGVFLDIDLKTADYDADGKGQGHEDQGDWRAVGAWTNYHACSLSSTMWGHCGISVGTEKKPFDLDALDGATLRVDQRPRAIESDDRAFGIYLLGHDGVGNHEITLRRRGKLWDIDWTAKIALEYIGEDEFKHRMFATITGVPFSGISIDDALTSAQAKAALARFVVDAGRWSLAGRKPRRRFVRA